MLAYLLVAFFDSLTVSIAPRPLPPVSLQTKTITRGAQQLRSGSHGSDSFRDSATRWRSPKAVRPRSLSKQNFPNHESVRTRTPCLDGSEPAPDTAQPFCTAVRAGLVELTEFVAHGSRPRSAVVLYSK